MAKQEEQKQKAKSAARQRKASASIPSRTSAARAAVKTLSREPVEEKTTDQSQEQTVEQPAKGQIPSEPRLINRRQLLIGGLGTAATVAAVGGWIWAETTHPITTPGTPLNEHTPGDHSVVRWNNAALEAIRKTQPTLPVAARSLAIIHTCMYDAWAAYDARALSTQSGARLRRPTEEQTLDNKTQAISYAAYRALVDLFPTELTSFQQIMDALNYSSTDASTDLGTPTGIGNVAARAVLNFRKHDNANQLGDLAHSSYADYTNYRPVNTSQTLKDPNHWQPQSVSIQNKAPVAQRFENAQWTDVVPFALNNTTNLLKTQGPPRYPDPRYTSQAQQVLQYSAALNDEQKTISEYWMNGPNNEQAPGIWCLYAQFISQRDSHSLDQNVKLFFALTNAALDTSIACWASKRAYDAPYPVTAIRYLFKGKQVQAWVGPGKGEQFINGAYWQPYQFANQHLLSFPEYCAENSAFAAAAAEILRNFTGNDRLGISYKRLAHTSQIEPDNPVLAVTLNWPTISQAAQQAGLSGLYSGIHFTQSDLDGRALGQKVGARVWLVAQNYINGIHS